MKRKELKELAKKIASLELSIEAAPDDEKNRQNAELEISRLAMRVSSLDEMDALDELIQDFLKNAH